jgi:hypothetical protein
MSAGPLERAFGWMVALEEVDSGHHICSAFSPAWLSLTHRRFNLPTQLPLHLIADSTLYPSSLRNISTPSTSTGSIDTYFSAYSLAHTRTTRVTERKHTFPQTTPSISIHGKWRIISARASFSPKQHASHASLARSHWPNPKPRAATTA